MAFGIILYALIGFIILMAGSYGVSKGLTMHSIKKIYLYLVSLVSLIIIIVGAIMLLNMGLKTYIFTKADNDYYSYPLCPVEVASPDGTKSKGDCNEEEQAKRNKENRAAQKQRDAAQAIAMIVVASPVFYYHWKMARKDS